MEAITWLSLEELAEAAQQQWDKPASCTPRSDAMRRTQHITSAVLQPKGHACIQWGGTPDKSKLRDDLQNNQPIIFQNVKVRKVKETIADFRVLEIRDNSVQPVILDWIHQALLGQLVKVERGL